MPTEIFGSVEVWSRELWHWIEVIDAGVLLPRNYAAFASLFGIGDAAPFLPLAPERGLPSDVSPAVARWSQPIRNPEEPGGFFGHSYLTFAEVAMMDGEQSAIDPYVHCYGRSEYSGEWVKVGKYLPDPPHGRRPGDHWMEEGVQCRVRTLTRNEALGKDFPLVFDLMARLADRYGPEHVRLVVWFQGETNS